MSYWAAVATIKAADLRTNTYRTARELLDLAAETGQIKISRAGLMAICRTEADGTMRRQLGEMQRAGIIHFSTNEDVHISFVDYPTVDEVITTRAPVITTCAPTITTRAQQCQETVNDSPPEPYEDDEVITTRASTITTRALPHTRGVSLFVSSSDPNQSGDINKQTNKHRTRKRTGPPPKPLTDEQERALALLTDPDVGLDLDLARRFAAEYEFDYLSRQVFEWRRQLAAGVAQSAGALVTRIRQGFGAVIIESDRASPLWQRHMQAETADDLRRKYIPDEYADIILG